MKSRSEKVAVIGSGIAGLSAAVRLAVAGKQVVVYEQNAYTGGKVSAFPIRYGTFTVHPPASRG